MHLCIPFFSSFHIYFKPYHQLAEYNLKKKIAVELLLSFFALLLLIVFFLLENQ